MAARAKDKRDRRLGAVVCLDVKDYSPELPDVVYDLMVMDGYSDDILPNILGLPKEQLRAWRKEYPELDSAIRRGRDQHNSQRVEAALLKRALGYDYEEKVSTLSADGLMVITKKTTKHVSPDVTAARIWLRNRWPERWPDTSDVSVVNNLTTERGAKVPKFDPNDPESVKKAYREVFGCDPETAEDSSGPAS